MSHSDCFNSLTAKRLRFLGAFCFAIVGFSSPALSQCLLTCNDGLQVSLDATGQVFVTTDLIAPNAADDCPGALQLKLFSPQGIPIPGNILNCNHIGLTVTAQVKHLASGNSCSGTLEVQDFLPPSVACADKFIFCNHDPAPAAVGFPVMTDNCTPSNSLTVNYIDDVNALPCGTMQNGQSVTKRIDRTWYVSDTQGNTTECLQKIWLKHITLANVTFPQSLDGIQHPALNCGQDPYDLATTGQPTVEGVPIENSPDCEFGVTFSDQTINICPPAGFSVIRTWTAIDFCSGQLTNRIQIIKVEDKTAPVVSPLEDITVGTDGFLCTGTVALPAAVTSDDCSAVTVSPSWAFGAGFGPFMGVAEGTHLVTYTITDACGNSTTTVLHVTVEDAAPPSAICATNLQVSLTAGGVGYVNAGTVNGGSFDNCGPVVLDISRDDSLFTQTVQVTCADIGPPLLFTLKVTDAVGLENFCVSEVSVRDFLKPNLQCPSAVSLTCLQDYHDQQFTGQAVASDNCALQSLDFVDIANVSPCNIGSVARIWKATDTGGNTRTCLQQITLNAVSNITVVFPADFTVSVCSGTSAILPPATGQPLASGQYCSPLSITYTDQVFNSALPPGCYRIFRAWKVIDFCIYDPNDDSTGVWEHTQIIDIVDDVPPVLMLPPDLTLNAGLPDCTAQVVLGDATAIDCNGQATISNNGIYAAASGPNASGVYPPGVHQVIFTATDNCGNSAQHTLTVTVKDLAPPNAACKNGLTLNIAVSGTLVLDASMLDAGSSDQCTLPANLQFSVSSDYYSCQNIGNQLVIMTVTDGAGNASTCSASIIVADTLGVCQPPPPPGHSIDGTIRTENGVPVAEIPLTLLADGFAANVECGADGTYHFDDLPEDNFYTLIPSNNAKWLNGLTTFDLVLISKHILGLDTIDSPYKMIAADANRSGSVTTFDIVQFRKVILGISDTVPGNSSWRFIDAAYSFPDPAAPFGAIFPEQKFFNAIPSDMGGQDFIGVKIGDLNNSTDATDPRSPRDTIYIGVRERLLSAGEQVAIPFMLEHWNTLEGFQFELQFDTEIIELDNIEFANPELFGAANVMVTPEGKVACSWDNARAKWMKPGDPLLFTLYLTATRSAALSSVVRIIPDRLAPEAYCGSPDSGAALALRIAENKNGLRDGIFEVFPARPNPFSDVAIVPFVLPGPAELTLTVADMSGNIVLQKTASFLSGYSEWRIGKEELADTGAYGFCIHSASGQKKEGVLIFKKE